MVQVVEVMLWWRVGYGSNEIWCHPLTLKFQLQKICQRSISFWLSVFLCLSVCLCLSLSLSLSLSLFHSRVVNVEEKSSRHVNIRSSPQHSVCDGSSRSWEGERPRLPSRARPQTCKKREDSSLIMGEPQGMSGVLQDVPSRVGPTHILLPLRAEPDFWQETIAVLLHCVLSAKSGYHPAYRFPFVNPCGMKGCRMSMKPRAYF